jgi:hypothetical protein
MLGNVRGPHQEQQRQQEQRLLLLLLLLLRQQQLPVKQKMLRKHSYLFLPCCGWQQMMHRTCC